MGLNPSKLTRKPTFSKILPMKIDHVHFYVDNAQYWCDWFVQVMGFECVGRGSSDHTHTEVVRSGAVKFVLSSPLNLTSPVAEYLQQHPPGVADVAFAVSNIETVMEKAVNCGAIVLKPLQKQQFSQGQLIWSQIIGKGGLRHTILQRHGMSSIVPFEWVSPTVTSDNPSCPFTGIDHIVLNVATGELEGVASEYETVFGFQRQQSFTIQTARSGLYSQVLVHPETGVQFPINEPASDNSQIQEFLNVNKGSGIQHLALTTPNIPSVTAKRRKAGLSFLHVPESYYSEVWEENPTVHYLASEWEEIMQQQILVDCQSEVCAGNNKVFPFLLQIFTQPIFGQPTFFFELIERRWQAQGFGEGNFRALFEAIEREQLKRGSLK